MVSAPSSNPDIQQRLEDLETQVARLLADGNISRAMTGPVWMDGVSIMNGSVSAEKLFVNTLESITVNTGNLNITGSLTAAQAFPATGARVVINSSGILGYRDATTTTFELRTDGSGRIGSGTTAATWNSSGVLSIPKAAIGSLTITDIAGGVLGGTYTTSQSSSRIDISTTGIIGYNGGVETFRLDGTTGAFSAIGSFTIKSNATGSRVEITNAGGISGYNGSTETFRLNAADGSGRLGSATSANRIEWSNGSVSIGGLVLSNGKLTANHLSVSQLSAISANLGTITAGSINAASATITNLNANNISNGSLGSGAAGLGLGGTNGLNINGNLTLAAGGKIVDADGSFWDQSGIVLKGGNDSFFFKDGGNNDAGSLGYDSTAFYVASRGNRSMYMQIVDGAATDDRGWRLVDSGGSTVFYICRYGHLCVNGNTAATGYDTLGTVIGRMAIYSTAHTAITPNLIGYIPIYNNIT